MEVGGGGAPRRVYNVGLIGRISTGERSEQACTLNQALLKLAFGCDEWKPNQGRQREYSGIWRQLVPKKASP